MLATYEHNTLSARLTQILSIFLSIPKRFRHKESSSLSLLQRVDAELVANEVANAAILLAEVRCQELSERRVEWA